MAVGPIMGYVSQYMLIKASKSVGSFSIDICGILLFANILRLNFYIFKQYETALFFQSLFMISMQVRIFCRRCSSCTSVVNTPTKRTKMRLRKSSLHSQNREPAVLSEFSSFGDGKPFKNMVSIDLLRSDHNLFCLLHLLHFPYFQAYSSRQCLWGTCRLGGSNVRGNEYREYRAY